MNEEEWLQLATEGRLTDKDAARIASVLDNDDDSFDRYSLLLSLGRAKAMQHRASVERFLHHNVDPMLSRLALQILCKFWSGTREYLSVVEEFLDGVDWDEDDDVRQMAVSIIGEYLRDVPDARLLTKLLAIVEDETEDEFIRADAYISVARAVGREWNDLPPLSRLPPLNELLDHSLLAKARTLAASK